MLQHWQCLRHSWRPCKASQAGCATQLHVYLAEGNELHVLQGGHSSIGTATLAWHVPPGSSLDQMRHCPGLRLCRCSPAQSALSLDQEGCLQ